MGVIRLLRKRGFVLALCTAAPLALGACGGAGTPRGTPTPASTPTAVPGSLQPSAFLTVEPAYATAMLWTLDYRLLAVFSEVDWPEPSPEMGVVAAPLGDPPKSLPFAFLDIGPRSASVIRFADGQSLSVLTLHSPTGIAGSIPGGFALVGDYSEGAARLYLLDLRTPQSADLSELVWSEAGPAAVPIAVRLDGVRPVEVFFSAAAEPSPEAGAKGRPLGLQSLWLETAETTTRVSPDILFLGISPDLAWYAISDPTGTPPQLEIRRHDSSASVVLQTVSGARAVGRAVFSPQGRSVAWPASVPSDDDTARTVIHIAPTSGAVPFLISPEQLRLPEGGRIIDAVPVAWLDEQTLLLQVDVEGQPQVLRMQSDGSEVQLAGRGIFVSLVYR